MDIDGGVILLLGASLLTVAWESMRRRQKKVLRDGYKAFATVMEYRPEFGRVAGSWTSLDYPYVFYQDREGAWKTERLKYATSGNHPFFIDQLIEVVYFEGVLYYRPALESWNLPIISMAAAAFLYGLLLLSGFDLSAWL